MILVEYLTAFEKTYTYSNLTDFESLCPGHLVNKEKSLDKQLLRFLIKVVSKVNMQPHNNASYFRLTHPAETDPACTE